MADSVDHVVHGFGKVPFMPVDVMPNAIGTAFSFFESYTGWSTKSTVVSHRNGTGQADDSTTIFAPRCSKSEPDTVIMGW